MQGGNLIANLPSESNLCVVSYSKQSSSKSAMIGSVGTLSSDIVYITIPLYGGGSMLYGRG
jgi:threonine/homoserine/homoserine lactone efflux protein